MRTCIHAPIHTHAHTQTHIYILPAHDVCNIEHVCTYVIINCDQFSDLLIMGLPIIIMSFNYSINKNDRLLKRYAPSYAH